MKLAWQQVEEVQEKFRQEAEGKNYKVEDVRFAEGYAEPGYDDPESGVIALGNWNDERVYNKETGKFDTTDDTMPRFAQALEELGVVLEWGDEWVSCHHCGKIVRCSGDSYSWMRSYWNDGEGGTYCVECVKEHYLQDYLAFLEGNESNADTFDLDLDECGYVQYDEKFEHGLYGGQADDPQIVARSLRALGVERFVFKIDSVGQFDMDFSVWIHKDEADKLKEIGFIQSAGADPAEVMQRALKNASIGSAALRQEQAEKGGVIYSKIGTDGNVETRLVSPEEFVEGIKD